MKIEYNAHVVVFETRTPLDKKEFTEAFKLMVAEAEVCARLGQQLGTIVTLKTVLNGESNAS